MIRRFFDSNGGYIEDGKPVFLSGKVIGGTPKFHSSNSVSENETRSALDNRESSISKMLRDRKLVKMIREGKGSDKGVKKEALAIEQENSRKPKEQWLNKKKQNLERMKREYKLGEYARRD